MRVHVWFNVKKLVYTNLNLKKITKLVNNWIACALKYQNSAYLHPES